MLLCDVVYMLRFLRFLARAGEACATVSNGWWTGGSAMSESQIYPKSFGLAVHCRKFQVLFFVSYLVEEQYRIVLCRIFYEILALPQVANLLIPIREFPATAVIALAPELVANIPLRLLELVLGLVCLG